jgi:hypothetical protein
MSVLADFARLERVRAMGYAHDSPLRCETTTPSRTDFINHYTGSSCLPFCLLAFFGIIIIIDYKKAWSVSVLSTSAKEDRKPRRQI